MDITQSRLREIINEEIVRLHSDSKLHEARVPGQEAEGPWDDDYAAYDDLTQEVLRTYKDGTPFEFIDIFEVMSPEEHAGIYHRLHDLGGHDVTSPEAKERMASLELYDAPKYGGQRHEEYMATKYKLKNAEYIQLAIVIRRMMDVETHEIRRLMTEPPHPRATEKKRLYRNYEEYFRSEVNPDFRGGDESKIIAKYMKSEEANVPLREIADPTLDQAKENLDSEFNKGEGNLEGIAAAIDALSAVINEKISGE